MATLEGCRRAADALARFERGEEGDAEWLAGHLEICPVCAPLGALPDETVRALHEPSAPRAAQADRASREEDSFFAAQRSAIMDAILRTGHNARIAPAARRAWSSRAASTRGRSTSRSRRALGTAIAAGIALVALGRTLVPTSGDDVARQPVQIARQSEVAPAANGATSLSRRARERAPLRGNASIAASRDAWLVADSDPLASPQVVSVVVGASDPFERLEDDDIEALSDLLGAYGGWNG